MTVKYYHLQSNCSLANLLLTRSWQYHFYC